MNPTKAEIVEWIEKATVWMHEHAYSGKDPREIPLPPTLPGSTALTDMQHAYNCPCRICLYGDTGI